MTDYSARLDLYVIMEEDRAGHRCVLDMIRMEDISRASVIRRARKLCPPASRVIVLEDNDPTKPATPIYKSRIA